MRRFKALINSGFAMFSQILIILLQFINRRFFVLFLSEEYLGANSLFADILNMLSVAELGLGSAIIFAMYKPFADGDVNQVKALIRFYKNAYLKIGVCVTTAGLLITPVLNFFVKDTGSVEHIEIIYLIVLFNTSVTYFFAYRTTILTVAQKSYISNISNVIFRILQLCIQMLVLYLTQSYILYLVVQFVCTIGNHLFLFIISKLQYKEYFREEKDCNLGKEEKTKLFKNIKALFIHKISSFLVNGTDNIILSKFMGLGITGVFSNYNLIFQNVFHIFTIPFSAITATVGNFVVSESKENTQKMFWKLNFVSFWLAVVCGVSLLNLSSPFISLFFGKQYQLSNAIPMIMTLNFYLNVMRQPVNVYKNTKGLFWQDRFKPVIESMINLLVGLILVDKLGILSVLLGTTASALVAGLIIEVHIIYKYGFEISSIQYYKRYFRDFFIASLIFIVTWLVCSWIRAHTIYALILKGAMCMVISNGVLYFIYRNTEEAVYYLEFMKEIIFAWTSKIKRRV